MAGVMLVAGGLTPVSIHISMVGSYQHKPSVSHGNGTIWYAWKGPYYSLKFTEMKFSHSN